MIRISASRYSAVAATAALVISLGGTSYAVTQIGTAQLKNNAVTSPKIKDGQVTGADVRNNGLTGADVRDNALTGADVNESRLGRVPQAGNAVTVGGNVVTHVRAFKAEGPGPAVLAFDSADLDVELRCSGTGAVDLVATTAVGNGTISTVVVGDQSPAPGEVVESDIEDGNFAENVEFDLLAGGNGDLNQLTFVYSGDLGSVVTGTLQVNYVSGAGQPCRVAGFVDAFLPSRGE
jgi:hypothetical protein